MNEKNMVIEPASDSECRPIPGETYRFTVMKQLYHTHEKLISGRKICEVAGLLPPENYKLDMKMVSGEYREVPLDMIIDLSESGLERFVYITRDQTEG